MANVKVPFVGYYALIGTVAFFSFLTWVLSWAAVGRISSFQGSFFYDDDDRGTAAVSALMAIIAMVNQALAVFDLVKTVRGSDMVSPIPISHWRSITLLVLIVLLTIFVIVCGAVSGKWVCQCHVTCRILIHLRLRTQLGLDQLRRGGCLRRFCSLDLDHRHPMVLCHSHGRLYTRYGRTSPHDQQRYGDGGHLLSDDTGRRVLLVSFMYTQ